MQNISGDVAKQKSHFDSVVLDSELRATPFDRSQFEKDVASLKEKLKSCDQVMRVCLHVLQDVHVLPYSEHSRHL